MNSSVSGSTVAKNAASMVISDRSRRSASAWKAATSRPDVASRSSSATFHARDAAGTGRTLRPSGGDDTELPHHAELVEATPALDDLAVANPEDVDARQRCTRSPKVRCRRSHLCACPTP